MLRPLFQIEVPSIGRIFRLVPRPHWQRRTRLSDKGSDCVRYLCPTFELPVAGAAALFCTANASPLHTNNCARHSWQRQRREHLHWCKLKKTMYALVFFALELWQGSWVHYSLYIKQGLQLSLEFQNTKSNPPFPPLCSFFSDALHTRVLHMCVEVFAACAYICAFHWNYYFFFTSMSLLQFHRSQFFTLPISDPPSSCNQFHHHQRIINALSSLCSLLPTFSWSAPFMDLCTN